MKSRLLILIFLTGLSLAAFPQKNSLSECDSIYLAAKKDSDAGRFEMALARLNVAKLCNPADKRNDSLILEIYHNINFQKEKAEQATKEATRASQKARIAEQNAKNISRDLIKTNALVSKQVEFLRYQQIQLQKTTDSARRLQNFALAIKHAEKSIAIPSYDTGRKTIKAHLALIAYQLLQESGDEKNKLQTQIYSALYEAIKSNIEDDSTNNFSWNVTTYREGADHIAYAALANNGKTKSTVYVSAENSRLYSFDLANYRHSPVKQIDSSDVFLNIKSSPDGRYLAMNTIDREVLLLDQKKGFASKQKIYIGKGITKFWLDDASLYAYNPDSGLAIIRHEDGVKSMYKPFSSKLQDFALSSNYFYGLTARDILKFKKDGSEIPGSHPIKRPDSKYPGTRIRCSPDDNLVVWGNENGQVYFIKEKSDTVQHLASFSGPITDIAISESGKLVAVGNYDKSIRVFDITHLEEEVPLILSDNEGPVTSVFFISDASQNETLVSVISPGLIRLYPMKAETLACKLYASYLTAKKPENLDRYVDASVEEKIRTINPPCN